VKKTLSSIFFIVLFNICLYTQTVDIDYGFKIKHYAIEITILTNGVLDIHEAIQVSVSKNINGIVRILPLKGEWKTIVDGSDISFPWKLVIDEIGSEQKIKKYIFENKLFIQLLGYMHGTYETNRTFELNYTVDGAINYQNQNYDELIWSLAGDLWPVGIEKVTLLVTLPGFKTSPMMIDQSVMYLDGGKLKQSKGFLTGNELHYYHELELGAHQKLLLYLKWKKGILKN